MWDKMQRRESGASFIKLKDGEAVSGIFRGEPYVFYKAYPDSTEYDEWADGRSFRFRINLVTKEGSEYVAKIYEAGSTVRDILMACRDEYGDELDAVFKIKRNGTGTDTTYNIMFQRKLTNADREMIGDVELNSLRFGGPKKAQEVDEPPLPKDEDFRPGDDGEEEQKLPF